ncbi:McrC family protein [Sphingobacterium sp. Mn56C]|uniref:McrC family protein n=1 Tax=Sphingobacterium sp. Mn56C TaxID=3395261 RepID=UPI003BD916C2
MALSERKHIIVFEHQKLVFDLSNEGDESLFYALVSYHGDYTPFFRLIRNGVQFCEFVGVLQVGDTLIEVLPKADKTVDDVTKSKWQGLLINMIRTVWGFSVKNSGSSSLKLKYNSVLDLYFELFISELEALFRAGLIKKYVREEKNTTALKGKLLFGKHIQNNLVHQERFYVETTKYAVDHELHQILYAALILLPHLNRNNLLASRIGNLLLNFPEQKPIKVVASTFSRIVYDRKTIVYQRALEIAELLLLNYHPDLSKGRRNVLALMFDMNALWEQFVLRVLQKQLSSHKVSGQISKAFWKSQGMSSSMRPDIVLEDRLSNEVIVLDTKWKNLNGYSPSPDDLRQMYVYHEYFSARRVALIYPGEGFTLDGQFYHKTHKELDDKHCHIVQIPADKDFKVWKDKIVERINYLLNLY